MSMYIGLLKNAKDIIYNYFRFGYPLSSGLCVYVCVWCWGGGWGGGGGGEFVIL